MLEENKTPLTLAVMARAEELAPNVGDQYDTDRLIRITNVSGSVFRRYELHRLGVHAPIASFGDTSTKKDRNWWLASQLLELDTKGLENPKAGEENAATEANDLQTQIEAIKKQHPHCDIEARVDPDGKLRILSVKGREGASTSHDDTTVVTIVNCDPPAEAAKECPVAKETQPTQEQLKAIFEHVTKLTAEQAKNLGFQYSLTARTNFPRIELQIVSFSKYGNNKDEWKCTIVHQSPTDPLHEQYSFQSSYDFETTCHRLWWPIKCEEWGDGENQVASQEELKGLFEHLENLSCDSEVLTRLTGIHSLFEDANGGQDSFYLVPKGSQFNWEIVVTKNLNGKYRCSTPFNFDHTCDLLGYGKLEASQQEFISLPVAEFQELQSQIKELMDWKNGMTKPQPIAEPVQEGTKNAVEFSFPPRPNPDKEAFYCIHYGGEKRYGDTVEEIAAILRRKGHEVRSTSARLVLKKPALWEALKIRIELQSCYREIVLEEIPFKHVEFPA